MYPKLTVALVRAVGDTPRSYPPCPPGPPTGDGAIPESTAVPDVPALQGKSGVTAVWDRSTSGQRVAVYLRSLIFEGELRSGDRVPQDDIAEALGCSRLPVREAVIALEHEGLVTIEPHRGAFVNQITPDTFHDQYELFGATLGIALRLAAERSGVAFLDDLRAVHAARVDAPDAATFAIENDRFQSLIITSARSPRLRAVLRVLSGIVGGNYFEVVPGSMEVHRAGTTAMVEALSAGDSDAAAAACLATMRSQGEQLVTLLQGRGFFELQTGDRR